MRHIFQDKQFKAMTSYFFLAVMVILAYKFIARIDIFLSFISWALNIISPFISGFILAYLLGIPSGGIQKLLLKSNNRLLGKFRKAISILFVYLMMFFIVYLILSVVIPYLYRSAALFVSNFAAYYRSAQGFIDYINNMEALNIEISLDELMLALREFSIRKLPSSVNAILSISSGLFSGFLALISSIYILVEKDKFIKHLHRVAGVLLRKPTYTVVVKYGREFNESFKRYLYTQTIDGFILGTVVTIQLFFLNSPYALALGIMLGVVNYIPYFGSTFGTIFAVLIVAFTQNIETAAIAAVVLLVTQQIDANVVQPRLLGDSFQLSPLLVIIGITIGGAISGIFGMIVAIPIIAVSKNILGEIFVNYERKKSEEQDDTLSEYTV